MAKPKGIIFYLEDLSNFFLNLSREDAGELIQAITEFVCNDKKVDLSNKYLELIFNSLISKTLTQVEKYQELCNKRAEWRKKAWENKEKKTSIDNYSSVKTSIDNYTGLDSTIDNYSNTNTKTNTKTNTNVFTSVNTDMDANNARAYVSEPLDVHQSISELKDYWNSICTSNPKAVRTTVMDEMNLRTILSYQEIGQNLELVKEQVKRISKSDFATGKINGWKMTFSKFLTDFESVLNGKYDGQQQKAKDYTGQYDDVEPQIVEL